MFNNLRAAYEPAIEAARPALDDEVSTSDGYRLLSAAILSGDADTARAAADALLRPATEAMVESGSRPTSGGEGNDDKPPPRSRPSPPSAWPEDESRITGAAGRAAVPASRSDQSGPSSGSTRARWMIATLLVGSVWRVARATATGGPAGPR